MASSPDCIAHLNLVALVSWSTYGFQGFEVDGCALLFVISVYPFLVCTPHDGALGERLIVHPLIRLPTPHKLRKVWLAVHIRFTLADCLSYQHNQLSWALPFE
jgi:hypothetical protein